jgi:5-(carboxyamino)imidazole ribonucleotide mutase
MDSLLSIVQMPPGVPVATVAIDGAKNAGILAAQILSVKYPELREAIKNHKEKLAKGA